MSNHDVLAAWGEISANDLPNGGHDKDTLRRVMALNPELRGKLGTTNKVLQALQRQPASEEQKSPVRQSGTFAEVVSQTKDRYATELRRLNAVLAKAQEDIRQLKPHILDGLIGGLIAIDPNMVSPMTLVVIKEEQRFLDEIAFTPQKVITRQFKRRS